MLIGINNISWPKRKVGLMVHVTEQVTLESATAPSAGSGEPDAPQPEAPEAS